MTTVFCTKSSYNSHRKTWIYVIIWDNFQAFYQSCLNHVIPFGRRLSCCKKWTYEEYYSFKVNVFSYFICKPKPSAYASKYSSPVLLWTIFWRVLGIAFVFMYSLLSFKYLTFSPSYFLLPVQDVLPIQSWINVTHFQMGALVIHLIGLDSFSKLLNNDKSLKGLYAFCSDWCLFWNILQSKNAHSTICTNLGS